MGSGAHGDARCPAAGAVPAMAAAARYDSVDPNRMVVVIGRPVGRSLRAEQRGSCPAHDGQGLNGLPSHHAAFCQSAVVAAQAKEDSDAGVPLVKESLEISGSRQRDRVSCGPRPRVAVAGEVEGLAVQGCKVLTPQSVHAVVRIGAGAALIVAKPAAMGRVTHDAATAVAVVRAQYVSPQSGVERRGWLTECWRGAGRGERRILGHRHTHRGKRYNYE